MGLDTPYERRSNLIFLVILLIFIWFLGLLGLSLRKGITLRSGEAAQPLKSFSKCAGTMSAQPLKFDLLSISLDPAKNIITRGYQALTNLPGFLVGLTKSPLYKFNSVKLVREAWQTKHAGIRVPSKYCRQ